MSDLRNFLTLALLVVAVISLGIIAYQRIIPIVQLLMELR